MLYKKLVEGDRYVFFFFPFVPHIRNVERNSMDSLPKFIEDSISGDPYRPFKFQFAIGGEKTELRSPCIFAGFIQYIGVDIIGAFRKWANENAKKIFQRKFPAEEHVEFANGFENDVRYLDVLKNWINQSVIVCQVTFEQSQISGSQSAEPLISGMECVKKLHSAMELDFPVWLPEVLAPWDKALGHFLADFRRKYINNVAESESKVADYVEIFKENLRGDSKMENPRKIHGNGLREEAIQEPISEEQKPGKPETAFL